MNAATLLPPPNRLEAADLEQLAHLLPPTAANLVRVAGTEAGLALLNRWPGVLYPVPKHADANAAGAARWAAIAAITGAQAMPAIAEHYGGSAIALPTCRSLLAEKRNRWLRARFDDLVDPHGPALPASAAVYELCLALAEAGQPMTYREVEKALARADAPPDDCQGDLFAIPSDTPTEES